MAISFLSSEGLSCLRCHARDDLKKHVIPTHYGAYELAHCDKADCIAAAITAISREARLPEPPDYIEIDNSNWSVEDWEKYKFKMETKAKWSSQWTGWDTGISP